MVLRLETPSCCASKPLRRPLKPKQICQKVIFLVKRSVIEFFQRENFAGLVPTKSLRKEDSEKVFGLYYNK